MFLRFFFLGVLAAVISLLAELMLFSFSPSQSITILALIVPIIEETLKFGLLWKGREFLPQKFSPAFFSAAGIFGLGFAIPETIIAESSGLATNLIAFNTAIIIHIISALCLSSALLLFLKKKPLSAFSLFIFSFALHALYNFFVFIQ